MKETPWTQFAPLPSSEVEEIHTPTLVVTGERSPRFWPLLATELSALPPNSTLTEISGASHIVHEANVTEFAGVVREFLAAHS